MNVFSLKNTGTFLSNDTSGGQIEPYISQKCLAEIHKGFAVFLSCEEKQVDTTQSLLFTNYQNTFVCMYAFSLWSV